LQRLSFLKMKVRFLLVARGFELRALNLLGRHSTV
jgi:hypothetical protein